nr:energy-coupled thiamine transporter ThiT [Maliibacterium massiliense]
MGNIFGDFAGLKGETWVAIVALLALAALLFAFRKKWDTRTIAYAAVCIAIAFLLSCVHFFRMPQGGSITPASMLPIMLFAYAFGPTAGIAAGTAFGLLHLLQDFFIMHPLSLIMDYLLAYASLGLAGFFQKNFTWGCVASGLARYLWHVLSGALFFGMYAWEGWNPWGYAFTYNALCIGPDLLICVLISLFPRVRSLAAQLQQNARQNRRVMRAKA